MSGISVERLLEKIDADISNFLIFAGVLDNNAKLLSFRKGKAFSLPLERHDTLDVQLSLMFSLIRQLEDISGIHKFTITRFGKHDIFLFGTNELHVFVITSPTSDGQVAKTLTDLVATMSDIEAPVASPTFTGRNKDQNMASAMTSFRHEEPPIERPQQKSAPTKPKSDAVAIMHGYLMALEAGCTIQDDAGGYYKIKANESDTFTWSTLEKFSEAFKDRIDIHHVGLDTDGRIFVRFSLK